LWLATVSGSGGIISNDQLYNISSGLDLRSEPAPIARFHDAAVKACLGDPDCERNQVVLTTEMPFNYPLAGLTGREMARYGVAEDFSSFAFRATAYSIALGGLCALLILVVGWTRLGAGERSSFAWLLLAGTALLLWRPAHSAIPVDLLELDQARKVGYLLAAAAGVPLLVAGVATPVRAAANRLGGWTVLILVAALLVAFSRSGALPWLGLPALAVCCCLLVLHLARNGAHPAAAAGLVLAIVIMLSSAHFLTLMAHVVPRANLFLASLPLLVIAMLRPGARWVLALPVLAVFHVSSAALIALMLCCAELWLLLWGRGSRRLLLVAGGTGLALYLYSKAAFTGLTENPAPVGVLVEQLATRQTACAALFALAMAALSVLLSQPGVNRPGSARAVLLLAGVFLLHQIDVQLASLSMFDSGLYVIKRAHVYCGPALITAAVFVIAIESLEQEAPAAPAFPPWRGVALWILVIAASWNVPAGAGLGEALPRALHTLRGLSDPVTLVPARLAGMRYDERYPLPCGRETATDSLKFLSYAKLRFKLWQDPANGAAMQIVKAEGCN
jgi:hypothetical protein